MLTVARKTGWDDEEAALLDEVAARAAVALQTTSRHHLDHQMAMTLQESVMLPQLAPVRGFRVQGLYQPAIAGIGAGGDWYDVIDLGDGRAVVALGDVMGKGLPAAVVMAELRASLRALVLLDPSPGAVIARLDAVVSHYEPDTLVTLAYGLVDTRKNVVSIAYAGQPPALQLSADGAVSFMAVEPAVPLGCGEVGGGPAVVRTFCLQPGDTFIFYSDGLVEARHRSITDGLSRLAAVAEAVVRSGRELLLEQLAAGAEDERDDDAAMLSVTVEAPSPAGQFLRGVVPQHGQQS